MPDPCATYFRATALVDVGEVEELHPPDSLGNVPRAERIARAAEGFSGGFHLLFVHADADGDAERARVERVDPGAEMVRTSLGRSGRRVIGVVPVRMTEAWALCDGDALRQAFSTRLSDVELGLPVKGSAIEGAAQPKELLERAFHVARPRRRRGSGPARFLEVLGRIVDLDALRRLDAYRKFEEELLAALVELGHARNRSA